MDPRTNPYAPGAGTQPPELAGRDPILSAADVALARILRGVAARGQMLLGLRGVGKTVLLNRIEQQATAQGFKTIFLEVPEDRPLATTIAPALWDLLRDLDATERAKEYAKTAFRTLRGFASAFKISMGGVDLSVEAEGEAASGDIETDLTKVFLEVATAARAADTGIAILVDEVQYLSPTDLAALIMALHRTGQSGLPLITFGAGLPQLAAMAGNAKSYAERLLSYPSVSALPRDDARAALCAPAERLGVAFTDTAVDAILHLTRGYPYFLQEWGSHVWQVATSSPITADDVERATKATQRALDDGFFKVRFDRCTDAERAYLRAMAELGDGPYTSAAIASAMKKSASNVATHRARLIKKGMIYSPKYGEADFTVPLFGDFLRRIMPTWNP